MRTPASWLGAALAVALIASAGFWWVTSGDSRLAEPLNFGNVYEAQTSSLLAGRTDIDCAIATGEAFVRDGKCYVYFGPVPGFLRWPVLWLAPRLSGQLGRPMVWIAQLLFLFVIGLMLTEAGHPFGSWSSTFYLLLTAFGSTIPYMWGWPLTYAEAITWAVALAAASLYCLLRWSRHGGASWIVGACLLAILAFFTRANTGAGLMAAVGLAALGGLRRRPAPGRRAQSAGTLILLGLAAWLFFALNHARMGTYFNTVPIQLHVQYDAGRLARVGGTLFHPEMGLPILMTYLFNLPHFRGGYPWLEYGAGPLSDLCGMDIVELHTGVLPMMPALVWLAWAGWRASRGKSVLWLLLSPLIGIALLVTVVAINQRYVHEFLLLLAPAGVYGLTWAMATRPRRCITYVLSAWSIYACWALALVGQREVMYWVSQDAYDRHCAMRSEIDQLLGGRPVSSPGAGGRMRLAPSGSIYEFDGAAWQRCAGPPAYLFRVRIRFSALPERAFDLLAVGKRPQANTLTLERGPAPGRYRVRMDHPGMASESGPEFELQADRDYLFECEFHRINGQMRVKLDGALIGQRRTGPLSWIENEVTVGSPGKWVQD